MSRKTLLRCSHDLISGISALLLASAQAVSTGIPSEGSQGEPREGGLDMAVCRVVGRFLPTRGIRWECNSGPGDGYQNRSSRCRSEMVNGWLSGEVFECGDPGNWRPTSGACCELGRWRFKRGEPRGREPWMVPWKAFYPCICLLDYSTGQRCVQVGCGTSPIWVIPLWNPPSGSELDARMQPRRRQMSGSGIVRLQSWYCTM